MLFYWLIVALKRFVWFLRLPKIEDLALVSPDARCPVCGAHEGRLRCVLKAKPGPVAKNPVIGGQILCQHTCAVCGARWFDSPIAKAVDPSKVLPAVARTDLETKEDRQAFLQEEGETASST